MLGQVANAGHAGISGADVPGPQVPAGNTFDPAQAALDLRQSLREAQWPDGAPARPEPDPAILAAHEAATENYDARLGRVRALEARYENSYHAAVAFDDFACAAQHPETLLNARAFEAIADRERLQANRALRPARAAFEQALDSMDRREIDLEEAWADHFQLLKSHEVEPVASAVEQFLAPGRPVDWQRPVLDLNELQRGLAANGLDLQWLEDRRMPLVDLLDRHLQHINGGRGFAEVVHLGHEAEAAHRGDEAAAAAADPAIEGPQGPDDDCKDDEAAAVPQDPRSSHKRRGDGADEGGGAGEGGSAKRPHLDGAPGV